MCPRAAWGWFFAVVVAGAFVAVAMAGQVVRSTEWGWLDIVVYGHAASLAIVAAVGALAGALLGLPALLRQRPVHPASGLWVLVLAGNVDWLHLVEPPAKAVVQAIGLLGVLVAARGLRAAGPKLGRIAVAACVGIVVTPLAVVAWRDVTALHHGQWWFEEPGLAGRLGALAARRAGSAHPLPDLYLVVSDRYPSVVEAARRGVPYPRVALQRLREAGWRIADEAVTEAPVTALTLASAFALGSTLTDGVAVRRGAHVMLSLFDADRLAWRRAFADPLLLKLLTLAGYETQGWIGWWLAMESVPFDRVDKAGFEFVSRGLVDATLRAWLATHLELLDVADRPVKGSLARLGFWSDHFHCQQLARQRERFFAAPPMARDGRSPVFVLYHLFWLHDEVNMNAFGECERFHAGATPLPGRAPLCLSDVEPDVVPGDVAGACFRNQVHASRVGAMIAYLPAFLERLELHARRRAAGRGFRILVLSDEGLNDPRAPGDGPHAHAHKHRSVFRATYAEGVPERWDPDAIPDIAGALRLVVEGLVGGSGLPADAPRVVSAGVTAR